MGQQNALPHVCAKLVLEPTLAVALLHAVEGEGVEANEVIRGHGVLVVHSELYNGQVWAVDGELECLIPARVEACNKTLHMYEEQQDIEFMYM